MTEHDPYTDVKLVDVLNDLRARELAVIAQYMRHHYLVTGPEGLALADEFKDIAITEMKHAEMLAERIDYLGGDPTITPEPILTGAVTLKEMAAEDYDAEIDAIARYRAGIKVARAEDDSVTKRLLQSILADEEDHHKTFGDMLGK